MDKRNRYKLLLFSLIFSALFYFSGEIFSRLFATGKDTIEFSLSAKGEGRVYLQQDKTGIEDFDLKPLHLKQSELDISIRALGKKNPMSHSDSIWLLKLESDVDVLDWKSLNLTGEKQWETFEYPSASSGLGIVSDAGETQILKCKLEGHFLKLHFLAHEWNGLLEVSVNGENQVLDTYVNRNGEPYGVEKSLIVYEAKPYFSGGDYRFVETVYRPSHFGNYYELFSDPSLVFELDSVNLEGESLRYELLENGNYRIYRNELLSPFLKGYLLALFFSACMTLIVYTWFYRILLPVGHIDYLLIGLFSFFLSLFLSFVFSPGIVTIDGMVRWTNALALLGEFSEPSYEVTDWFPLIYSSILALSYKLSGGFTFIVFLQAAFFWFVIAWISLLFCGKRLGTLIFAFLLFLPPVFLYSVYNSNDVIACSLLGALSCLCYFLSKVEKTENKVYLQIAYWLCVLLLLLFRNNCMALVPLFILFYCWLCSFKKRAFYVSLIATIICVFVLRSHTSWLGVERIEKTAMIYLWEHIQTLKIAADDDLTSRHSLDDLGIDTKEAIVACKSDMVDNLIFFSNPTCPIKVVLKNADTIQSRCFNLIRERPEAWFKNRMLIYKELMGLGRPMMYLKVNEFGECEKSHVKGDKIDLTYKRSLRHPALYWANLSDRFVANPFISFVYKPWCMFILLLFLLTICLYQKVRLSKVSIILLCLGLAYYGTFFILTPAVLFRYYFASFILLFIASASLVRSLFWAIKEGKMT